MSSHAILSASSSKRWLNCPPSAKLCAEVEDTTSEYAREGTDAHTLCEYKVKSMLGIEMQRSPFGCSLTQQGRKGAAALAKAPSHGKHRSAWLC